jgi:N-ethylmaleimide reductase
MTKLLSRTRIGRYELSNHLVMAPMTRSRADADGVVGDMTVTYYAQRASAGLMLVSWQVSALIGKVQFLIFAG